MYKTFVSTLHCALENGAGLYVNERQKIRHLVTIMLGLLKKEEVEKRRMSNHDFLFRAMRT